MLSIKVKASHVNKIVNLVAEWHRWEFLQLLNTLAKIDLLDLPIRRNQNLVIKYMMQQRNETVLLVNDDQNEERIKLMENGTAEAETVTQYIQRRRLEECARALIDAPVRDRLVTEIAFDYGFNSLTHFGRVFRNQFGLTPSEYRRAAKD